MRTPKRPIVDKTDRELLEDLHHNWATQQEINQRREKQLQDQSELNKRRQAQIDEINTNIGKIKEDQAVNNVILGKLENLWFHDGGSHSRAIGAWSIWKLLGWLFGSLFGIVLFYQILVPILIAAHNAIMNATLMSH